MLGDFTSWSWIGGAIFFGLGAVVGYILARQIKGQRTRQLEQDLDAARKELGGYRSDVNRHFLKTSLLFNRLTDDYREIYEHLATGAKNLCPEQANTNKPNLPESEILSAADTSSEAINHIPADKLEGDNETTATETKPTTPKSSAETAYAGEETLTKQGIVSEVSASEKSMLMEDEDVPLGEEAAPAMNFNPDRNRSIH